MRDTDAVAATPTPAGVLPFTDGLPVPRRYWSILAIALGIMMAVLDGAIANVALPVIAREFATTASTSIWVINAYQIAVVMSLLPLAALGEIVGYRRVSQVGLVVFTIASLACSMADSILTLTLARVVQGFGAAGIMSVNGALVRFTYPQRLLGTAVGINAVVVAMSAAIGPTVASLILSVASWRWLFGINVPLGVLTIFLATVSLPASEKADRRFNLVGTLLSAAAFGFLITGVQSLAHEEAALWTATELALGTAAAVALYRHERHRAAPLIPFDLFRNRLFSLSVMTSICSFAAQMLAFVALPFHFHEHLGLSAVQTGFLITPWPLAVAVSAPLAGWLSDRVSAGLLGAGGLVVFALGLFALAALPVQAAPADIIWRMALCGLGFGFFQSPNNRVMLSAAPRSRAGAAGGMVGTARLLGQTAGAATVAVLLGAYGYPGTTVALYAAAGVALVAAAVSSVRPTPAA